MRAALGKNVFFSSSNLCRVLFSRDIMFWVSARKTEKWRASCLWRVTARERKHHSNSTNKRKIYSKSQKENGKICLRVEMRSGTMPACILASVNLIALVLFPSPSPCSNMIRFTGMSKWVILFIHCSCLDPNITRRIKASESQQEVKH